MTIDELHKWSDIVFKGAVAAVLGAATLYVSILGFSGDKAKICDEMLGSLITFADGATGTEKIRNVVSYRIAAYNQLCAPGLGEKEVDGIMAMLESEAVNDIPDTPPTPGQLAGWVALSRIPADQYADTNFDNLTRPTDTSFGAGDDAKARWSVNIRRTNTPVSSTDNPVVDVLQGGDCIKIASIEKGTLNVWGHISRITCPP